MDTRWLQDFITLAEARNFTRAAEIRNLSQAAFSRRIQSLEQWVGAKLIDRNAYPTQLTEAGEKFHSAALELTSHLSEVRAAVGGTPMRNQIRIAASYSLATTRLPRWWQRWDAEQSFFCSLQTGNVHDTVSAFTAGTADLLLCYYQTAHALPLDPARYECLNLGADVIRPYAAPSLLADARLALPGSAQHPIPLLMYSPSVYFARLIDTAIETAPRKLYGARIFEAEMSDVLRDLAQQGLGVAWLAESTLLPWVDDTPKLVPLTSRDWDIHIDMLAYKAKNNTRPTVMALWHRMKKNTVYQWP